jgi:hypothetical protein
MALPSDCFLPTHSPHLIIYERRFPGLYERRARVMGFYEYLTVITVIAIILYIIKK